MAVEGWFYLFALKNATVRDSVRAAWAAGSIAGVPPGSDLRTVSVGGIHGAVLLFASTGSAPPFDALIPSSTNWTLIRSGPLQAGEDPFALTINIVEALLPQLGAATPLLAGGG